ncbi:MAG: lamin tail domain-containing protein [Patescibacteria group bacterium]|nr:lamin tail domain-containing protein [Patescibacteria group bacterium]
MNRLSTKFISILLLIVLNGSMFFTVGETFGFFTDVEKNQDSSFEIGILDFSLNSTGNFAEAVTPTQTSVQNISVLNPGTLGFQYSISATDFSGALCDHLLLTSTLDGLPKYSGALTSLTDYAVGEFSDPDDWVFTVTLDGDNPAYQGESCSFKFLFNGWQTNFLDNTQGFTDTEEVLNIVYAGTWQGSWVQTTEPEFEAGNGTNVDTDSVPGDVSLPIDGSGSTNLSSGAIATADSSDTTHAPSKAIDGGTTGNSYWKGTSDDFGWLTIDLGSPRLVNKIVLLFRNNPSQKPEDYRLESSLTGAFAGEEVLIENVVGNASDGPLEYTFAPISARYVRIFITKLKSNGQPAVIEFEIYPAAYNLSGGSIISQSSPDEGKMLAWESLEWTEETPAGTDIGLQVSTSNNASDWSTWEPLSYSSSTDLSGLPNSRYIRWRASLETVDGVNTPTLHDVTIKYLPSTASSDIVMNEFLPNPSGLIPDYGFDFGEDNSLMSQGEWVEIYNKGTANIDLAEWEIEDSTSNIIPIDLSHIMVASTVIAPGDYLVVYMNAETLDNSAETIYLKDMFGNTIDSYSYDLISACALEPTPDNPNTGVPSGDCDTVVPGNKSYARIPDGIGAWVDPIPTPAQPNKITVEEEVLVQEIFIEEEILTEAVIEHLEESLVFSMSTQGSTNTSDGTVIEETIVEEDEIIIEDPIIPLETEAITTVPVIEETVDIDTPTTTLSFLESTEEAPIDEEVLIIEELIDPSIVAIEEEVIIEEELIEEPVVEEVIPEETGEESPVIEIVLEEAIVIEEEIIGIVEETVIETTNQEENNSSNE